MISRRDFLSIGAANATLLVALSRDRNPARPVREFTLTARREELEIAGRATEALTYNGLLPGPEIRVRKGDLVRVHFHNRLSEASTIHWHGLPVPHAMDGVPNLTQPPVRPGESFTYEFVADFAGTYWYHSHFAFQFERGLYGALIVEDELELEVDREFVLILDDWLANPHSPAQAARPHNAQIAGITMGSPMMSTQHDMSVHQATPQPRAEIDRESHGTPKPEPIFSSYVLNGAAASEVLPVKPRERVRLRVVNAGTATVFPFYLAGHRLTLTHLDGQPVEPLEIECFPIGMGERADFLFEADNPGVWQLGSWDEMHAGATATLRYAGSSSKAARVGPPRISPTPYALIRGRRQRPERSADVEFQLAFRSGGMTDWSINGRRYPDTEPIEVWEGQRVRLRLINQSEFAHPIHLHGHFFDVVQPYGSAAVSHPIRKDTLTLYHIDQHVVEFIADNPGPRWLLHCHNQYHHVAGMATEVRYGL